MMALHSTTVRSLRFAFLAGNRAGKSTLVRITSAPQPFEPRDKGIARLRLNV